MARLTIEKGASPQIGQKKITNYEYIMTGDNTQDIMYDYTETETHPLSPPVPRTMYMPSGLVNQSVFGGEVWHNEQIEGGLDATGEYTTVQIVTGPDGSTTSVNKCTNLRAYYADGADAGFLSSVSPQSGDIPSPTDPEAVGTMSICINCDASLAQATKRDDFISTIITDANGNPTDQCRMTSALKEPITGVRWIHQLYYSRPYRDSETGEIHYYWTVYGLMEVTRPQYGQTLDLPNHVVDAALKTRRTYNCELTLQEVT